MMNTKAYFGATGLALGSLVLAAPALATPVVFEATGQFPQDIQREVDEFRKYLGKDNGVGGSFDDGRREINWDAVPDDFAAPDLFPPTFSISTRRAASSFSPPEPASK